MYLVLALGTAAIAVVVAWNHYSASRPDLADSTTTRAHQLAAVVLVLAKAIEGVLEALTYTRTNQVRVTSGPQGRPLVDMWDDEDYR